MNYMAKLSRWALGCQRCHSPPPGHRALALAIRQFSSTARLRTPHTEHIQVPCASCGYVTVSLHDIAKHPAPSPLVINLPDFPVQDISAVNTYLPRFLHRYPTATIHYRWHQSGSPAATHQRGATSSSDHPPTPPPPPPPRWPTPIHDTLAGYDFLTRKLTPPPDSPYGHSRLQRRDIFVYGRHLGAGLAVSLALTEAHVHAPIAVRGVLTVNGVYNWTTFLPDHPVNTARLALRRELGGAGFFDAPGADGDIARMQALLPRLFDRPGDLFDPFASPVLFFHTAGLMVPPSFTEQWKPDYLTNKMVPSPALSPSSSSSSSSGPALDHCDYVYSDPDDPPPPSPFPDAADGALLPAAPAMVPPPRKGYLAFPPRASTLRIPATLLLHSRAPPPPTWMASAAAAAAAAGRPRGAVWKQVRNAENSFGSQAAGLAGLMRRSVRKLEARERMRWDVEFDDPEGEAGSRVGTGEVAVGGGAEVDGAEAAEMARQWLEDRLG